MADNISKIQEILAPILASKGLTLWELEFKKDGPAWLLRVYIDREAGGVTLDDCESVSKDLGAVIDVEEVISHSYTLEVSSPGLDRSLTRPEHYGKCIGLQVKIKTYQAIDGQKVFVGTLQGFQDGQATVRAGNGIVMVFPLSAIAKASLEVVI